MNESIRVGIIKGLICPYCMRKSSYINSSEVYGRDFGQLYACLDCKAWVGVHHQTSRVALGRLANSELRNLKMAAHRHLDPLWKRKTKSGVNEYEARKAAYAWLSREMGTPLDETHIGMFDEKQCKKVISLCKKYL
jgi:hypothetical protein